MPFFLTASRLTFLTASLIAISPLINGKESENFLDYIKEKYENDAIALDNEHEEEYENDAMALDNEHEEEYENDAIVLDDEQEENNSDDAHEAEAIVDAQPNKQRSSYDSAAPNVPACMTADYPHRVGISHVESKGIGYNQGYTSLEGFFTGKYRCYVPFIDARAHVFNNGKWASNIGFGTRYVINPAMYMVGGNFYYDYRNTKHYHYNQIGVGLEGYISRWELRANGYLPVGKKRKRLDHDLNWISFKGFSGNNILINENYTDTFELAMRGFNAEVGVHPLKNMACYDLFIGAGPYYFNADDGRTTWGGKIRVKAEVTKYLYLELSNSYDHIFHDRFQGTLTLSYPFGGKRCYRQKSKSNNTQLIDNIMYWRAVQPVERQEIIVTSKHKKTYTKDPIAKDPLTGQPYFVVFVNNTANTATANGTFENPFPYLSHLDGPPGNTINAETESAPGNSIYVFTGTGTVSNMSNGIILQQNQRFLGSATPHPYLTTKGLLIIPPQTTRLPHIQGNFLAVGGPRNGVVLSDNCEVSGFDISFPEPANISTPTVSNNLGCIVGTGNSAYINNNNVVNETYGIHVGNFSPPSQGTFIIVNNTGGFHTSGSPGPQGFSCVVSASNATINIENNTFSDDYNGASGIFVHMFDNVNLSVANNVIYNEMSGAGIVVVNDNPGLGLTSHAIISGNNISFVSGGIICNTSETGLRQYIVENNIISNMQPDSMMSPTRAIQISTITAAASMCARCNGNTGINNVSPEILIINDPGATLLLEPPVDNNMSISITGTFTPANACDCGRGDSCP
ncbi:MAG TPA: inverse autotransporter beta domain-containing protein [Rhabdochlamydiaceae bacterium]